MKTLKHLKSLIHIDFTKILKLNTVYFFYACYIQYYQYNQNENSN